MTSSADLRADVLHAMRRLASRGEVDVAPSRIADLIGQDGPRPSLGAMWRAMEVLEDRGEVQDGKVGVDRFRLSPAPWSPDPEALRMEV